MNLLSTCLITFNEEHNLPRVLNSVQELRTKLWSWIAEARPHGGDRAKSRSKSRYACGGRILQNKKTSPAAAASHDWILSLDADEELSGTLQSSLLDWKGACRSIPSTKWRDALYLGGWINHSDVSDFNDGFTVAAQRTSTESSTSPCNSKASRTLEGDLLHYTMRSFAEHEGKVERTRRSRHSSCMRGEAKLAGPLYGWQCMELVSEFLSARRVPGAIAVP